MRFFRRLSGLLLALLPAALAAGELAWPGTLTPGQASLRAYMEEVNVALSIQGEGAINSLFELYPSLAVLGITGAEMAEAPEGVELTFTLSEDRLESLELRVNEPERVAVIAGCCIQAASGELSAAQAMEGPQAYVRRVKKSPLTGFEEPVVTGAGAQLRTYYAYYPDQYRDGVSWLQLTLIFGAQPEAEAMVTPVPDASGEYLVLDQGAEDGHYSDYGHPYDGENHFDVFLTPTPEPDPFGEGSP